MVAKGLMKAQANVSMQRGMPVESLETARLLTIVEPASVPLYYYNSGVLTADAGQLAGVKVVAQLSQRKICTALGNVVAHLTSGSSLSFTAGALTTEVFMDEEEFEKLDECSPSEKLTRICASTNNNLGRAITNGEYVVDRRTGTIYGVKTTAATSLAAVTYKVWGEVMVGALGSTGAGTSTAPLTSVALYNRSVSTSNFLVLSANTARRKVVIVNDGAATVYVKEGAVATVNDYTYRIPAYGTQIIDGAVYTGIIDAIGDSSVGTLRVTEGI